ncbi:MAG: hypothetical protein ACFNMD_05120 [Prevotella sp.]
MKIKQILFAVGAAFLLAACTGNENIENEQKKTVEIENITITEEPFEPEAPSTTRAAQAPQIVDLGDGITAEVSLTEDAQEQPAQTRAAIADGHYTIYVTKPTGITPPGTSAPILAKLSGTVQGNKFVRDATSPKMRLAPDTYTFICVNDAISKIVHGYHGDSFALYNDKDNPMIGVTSMAVSGEMTEVPFVMKHRNSSRVRFQITSYTNEGQGITGKLSFTNIAATTYFDMEGRWFGSIPGAFTSGTYTFAESAVTPSAYTQVIKRTTDYRYLTSDISGSNAQFTIDGGTIYGKSLAGKSFPLTAISNLQENKSYTCNIKLKPNALYLFQDGTVGVLAEKGTRTPIGVVARDKTPTQAGMAAALDIIKKNDGLAYFWEDESVTGHGDIQLNTTVYNGLWDGQNDMNGYNWTWDANSTIDHVVRAEEQAKYPAFYMAGHYQPSVGVTGSNVGKWYIPAIGEVIQLFRMFGEVTVPASEPWGGNFHMSNADMNKVIKAFTDVNSNTQLHYNFLWTSTTSDASNSYYPLSFKTGGYSL